MTGTDCRRTRELTDRLVRGSVSGDDRAHALDCASCGTVLARAAAFEDELRRSARSLVVEELPRGIVDPGVAVPADGPRPSRGFAPGFSAAAAAVAIILLATAVAFDPGRTGPSGTPGASLGESPGSTIGPSIGPSNGPTPMGPFNSTSLIASTAQDLGYSCREGVALATSGPSAGIAVRESAVCSALNSGGPYVATIIVGVSATGEVVNVSIKVELVGSDTPSSRDAAALAMANLSLISLADKDAGGTSSDFVLGKLPALEPIGPKLTTEIGGTRLRLERLDDGAYLVTLELALPS